MDPDGRRLRRRGPPRARRPARSDARAFARGGAPVGFSSLGRLRLSVRARRLAGRPVGAARGRGPRAAPGFTDAQAFDANHHGLIVGEARTPRGAINGSIVRHAVAWAPKRDGELRGRGPRRAGGLRREQRLRSQRARGDRRHRAPARDGRQRRHVPARRRGRVATPASCATALPRRGPRPPLAPGPAPQPEPHDQHGRASSSPRPTASHSGARWSAAPSSGSAGAAGSPGPTSCPFPRASPMPSPTT